MKHQLYVETLWHFRCCNCDKFWTLSDVTNVKKEYSCPRCGKAAGFVRIENRNVYDKELCRTSDQG